GVQSSGYSALRQSSGSPVSAVSSVSAVSLSSVSADSDSPSPDSDSDSPSADSLADCVLDSSCADPPVGPLHAVHVVKPSARTPLIRMADEHTASRDSAAWATIASHDQRERSIR